MLAQSIPSVDELIQFWGDEADDIDEDRASLVINLATNLFWLATEVDNDPTEPRLLVMVKYAIADMALYLYISREDVQSDYSPFYSERIGSYSYTKSYSKAQSDIASQKPTGVLFFDRVVQWYIDSAMYDGGLTTSESVFHQGYTPLNVMAWGFVINPKDPSRRTIYSAFGNADDDEGQYQNY